ncbi:hypothetical protein [Dyadobacter arcticus]|uniref:SHOCT domain-containing protein n=1 Tax=Dyadobacter arcticus TaxID=1078754 RepID=A0ABX0UJ03_9BACT|nr:hypothetical protein [Dyadobacter arcticus]NIJ52887.1 hypothetical protein [Dyadobacter arcticus]
MILLDLLFVLFVGICCFLVSHVIEYLFRPKRRRRVRRKHRPIPIQRNRHHIEADLDRLLVLYKQGKLNEQQYDYEANQLIDQLSSHLSLQS